MISLSKVSYAKKKEMGYAKKEEKIHAKGHEKKKRMDKCPNE
jgi:hypothetical protein